MLIQFNPNKLSKHSFFMPLINYLYDNQPVTLRQIRSAFPNQKNLDRFLEEVIAAGYVVRQERRYTISLPFLTDLSELTLESHFFVDDQVPIYRELLDVSFRTVLRNETNDLLILEDTSIQRDELTFANYFYKVKEKLPLSVGQEALFDLLGDVNVEYFLKHTTTFLLKFLRKDSVLQKRRNIFVDALELLGYIRQVEEGRYTLNMTIDEENLSFLAKKD